MKVRSALLALAVTTLVACSTTNRNSAPSDTLGGIGILPDNNLTVGAGVNNAAFQSQITGPIIGSVAKGNRLLVIGDSILAGTAARYGNTLCKQVVQMGWRVAVEAEAGQAADFGREVLKSRLSDGWDAAVVLLGTNPSSSIQVFTRDFTAIITSLAPRPVLVLTTSRYKPRQDAVNAAIRSIAASNPNVTLMDWGSISSAPDVLNSDGIHPTDAGRAVLVAAIGQALGPAPGLPGKCLDSKFTDDSLNDSVMGTTTSNPGSADVATSVPSTSTTTK